MRLIFCLIAACFALAACSTTLSPGPIAGFSPSTAADAPDPNSAALDDQVVFLAPITQMHQAKAASLSDLIVKLAEDEGITVTLDAEMPKTLQITSELTAIPSPPITQVVYVFTISDQEGTPQHIISGQVLSDSSEPDGWSAVGNDQIETIAKDFISNLRIWMMRRAS